MKKKYLIISILIITIISIGLFYYFNKKAEAASSGPNNPSTVVNVANGGSDWADPTNASASDDSYASTTAYIYPSALVVRDQEIKIVKSDSSIGTTNKANTSTNWPTSDAYASYGGAEDLWGESWSNTDINSSNFGVVVRVKLREASDPDSYQISDYLKATDFGFSIPSGTTIDGIVAEVERKAIDNSPSIVANIDHIRITVYYTEGATDNPEGDVEIKQGTLQVKQGTLQIK